MKNKTMQGFLLALLGFIILAFALAGIIYLQHELEGAATGKLNETGTYIFVWSLLLSPFYLAAAAVSWASLKTVWYLHRRDAREKEYEAKRSRRVTIHRGAPHATRHKVQT